MKTITIEQLKEEFNAVKELIIALSDDNRVILKPMSEISSFLRDLPPLDADIALDDIEDMYDNGILSESYLKEWDKLTFDMYLKSKRNLVNNKLEFERIPSEENHKDVIKEKLNELLTKDLKIEYLIDILDQFEECPNKQIENNEVYIYVSKKLDRIDKLSDNNKQKEKDTPIPQRLQTKLTTDKRSILFTELVNGGFIPNENKDCFNWAISATNEEKPKQPGQWQSIKWNMKKDAFWLLFEPILGTISNKNKLSMKILFLDKDDKPMDKLRKPQPKDKSRLQNEIEDILRTIGIITEQPFKHKPIR
jgi:hypothetical protein